MILAQNRLQPLNGNKIITMKKLILVVFVMFFTLIIHAQPGKVDVETIEGKKYYVHFVEKGQTLYQIHQIYNVPIDEITKANNGLNGDLQIGQKILIPISTNNTKYYDEHIVKKGETLYGISKQYNCSVKDLKNLNPELNETAISIGQKLIVPSTQKPVDGNLEQIGGEQIILDPENRTPKHVSINEQDSIIKHVVLPHETLYAISKRYMVSMQSIKELNNLVSNAVKQGDTLLIKVKNVNYTISENPLDDTIQVVLVDTNLYKKDVYKVALFLPLLLDANKSYMNKPLQPGQVASLHPTTQIAVDFYHGFLLAADSLTKAGLNVELYVYDTKKDTNEIAKIINKPEFKDIDIIFGPLLPHTINYVSDYCKKSKTKMVIPFNSSTSILYQNPSIYKATASNLTLIKGMVDYIVENHSHHYITIVKPTSKDDLPLYELARERFNTKITLHNNALNSNIIELSLGSSGGREMNLKLRKDTVNVVIVPSTDLKFVAGVFTRLNNILNINTYAKNMKIIVFGLEDWNKFSDLDLAHKMRLHQHYASYRYLDYDAYEAKKMFLSFRHKFSTDPDVYGVQGFDVGFYFLSTLYLYGVNFDNYIEKYQIKTVQNEFYFPQNAENNGKENHHVYIIEYADYQLLKKASRNIED